MECGTGNRQLPLRNRSGAHGSWFLASEIGPGKVDGQFTSVGRSGFWMKDKDQQLHPNTYETMEKSYMKFTNLVATMAVLSAGLIATSPAHAAGDKATHEARIQELEKTVLELKALLEQQACASDATCSRVEQAEDAVAHSQIQPSTYKETTIKVGGFAKLDAIVSDYSRAPIRGIGEDFFIPATINTSGAPSDPNLNVHAKETRFWLKSITPTMRGDISTYFEIDFMASAQGNERTVNAYSPRLRHAYINAGRWTLGQTWTTFGDTTSVPEYLDDLGPVGVANARQAQIRYTLPTDNGSWMFALENPETTLTPFGGGSRIAADDSGFPDVIVRRNWTGSWGAFNVAGLLRELKIDSGGFDDTVLGGGIALSGKYKVGDQDDIRWQINYGEGLGRYMGMNSYNGGTLDANGEINLTTQYGGLAAYRHVRNDSMHSTLGVSFSNADNDTALSGFDVPESFQSVHANLIWSPIERMSLGAEYIWGQRKDESGNDGTLSRIQLSAIYLY